MPKGSFGYEDETFSMALHETNSYLCALINAHNL